MMVLFTNMHVCMYGSDTAQMYGNDIASDTCAIMFATAPGTLVSGSRLLDKLLHYLY